jgi:hypothetical protein
VGFLLTLLLVVIGLLLLLLSLAVVAFGTYMALDERHREPGVFLAIWWIPAVAASIGILMRDLVTLTVGVLCFVVAGAALVSSRRTGTGGTRKAAFYESAKRRISNKIKEYRKAIS